MNVPKHYDTVLNCQHLFWTVNTRLQPYTRIFEPLYTFSDPYYVSLTSLSRFRTPAPVFKTQRPPSSPHTHFQVYTPVSETHHPFWTHSTRFHPLLLVFTRSHPLPLVLIRLYSVLPIPIRFYLFQLVPIRSYPFQPVSIRSQPFSLVSTYSHLLLLVFIRSYLDSFIFICLYPSLPITSLHTCIHHLTHSHQPPAHSPRHFRPPSTILGHHYVFQYILARFHAFIAPVNRS